MSQARDQIDAVVSSLWPAVVAQQNGYYATHGSFYQLLWTHNEPPAEPTPPDALGNRPTDQPASPIQGLPALMRSRMRIDTYGKPDGWTMTLEARIDGTAWIRSIDCGMDASRTINWRELELS